VDSVLSYYSWCHSCLYKFISMVDRYFMPTGSQLLRTRADEHRSVQLSWVKLSWVLSQYMSSWVGLSCAVSVDMHSALRKFRLQWSERVRKTVPQASACDRKCTIADGDEWRWSNDETIGWRRAKTSTRRHVSNSDEVSRKVARSRALKTAEHQSR